MKFSVIRQFMQPDLNAHYKHYSHQGNVLAYDRKKIDWTHQKSKALISSRVERLAFTSMCKIKNKQNRKPNLLLVPCTKLKFKINHKFNNKLKKIRILGNDVHSFSFDSDNKY